MPDDTPGFATPAPTEADPRIGVEVAGRYRIVANLGRGGMGAVYEVEHLTTLKRFAMKSLLPEMGAIGELAQRFAREARAQSRLSHPHIVSVTDFGTLEDGALFYVMELVRGETLGDLLKKGVELELGRALRIARRTLEGLSHAHRNGIIHRDLKPDNIMLVAVGESEDERDLVKLFDFGIAKLVGDAEGEMGGEKLTKAGMAFGTPDYMSPEQALGDQVDGRADLYSLGVILFEMLTGRKPFENEDKLAVVRMQVSVPPPSLATAAPGKSFPAAVETLVARALEKRKSDRFPDCDAMIAAIDAAGQPSRASAAAPTVAISEKLIRLPRFKLPDVRGFLAGLSTKTRIAAAAAAILILLVAIALLSGGGPGNKGTGGALAPAKPIRMPLEKTALASQAQGLLEAGDAGGVVALLEDALSTGDGQHDGYGHLYLGHARMQLGREVEALAAWERAVEIGQELGRDPTMRRHVGAMVNRKDRTVAMAALDLAAKMGSPGEPILVEAASRHKTREIRQRARELADKVDASGVDLLESYSLDLKDGKKCEDRREAIPKLRALRDKRAIPILEKAANRRGGWFGLSDVNNCLEAEAEEAIQHLEMLP